MQLFKAKLERTGATAARMARPWHFCGGCGRALPPVLYGRICNVCAEWATGHIRRHQDKVRRRWLRVTA